MTSCVVLDKSYLQSVSARRLQEVGSLHQLVMTDALFYELLTTDPAARARCFAKFPATENPVRIVGHIGPMILHEQRTHTKSRAFLEYELAERFRFNRALANVDYQMPPESEGHTAEETRRVHDEVADYIERVQAAVGFFPGVLTGSDSARLGALYESEREIAAPQTIIDLFASIGDPRLPPAELISEDWACFRLYQVKLLFDLHTLHRLRGPLPGIISDREFTRLEHDIHDATLFLVAAMAGGLATREKKLIRWWQLLFPNKLLYTD